MEYPNDCWQSDVSTGLYFKTTFSRFNPGGEYIQDGIYPKSVNPKNEYT